MKGNWDAGGAAPDVMHKLGLSTEWGPIHPNLQCVQFSLYRVDSNLVLELWFLSGTYQPLEISTLKPRDACLATMSWCCAEEGCIH